MRKFIFATLLLLFFFTSFSQKVVLKMSESDAVSIVNNEKSAFSFTTSMKTLTFDNVKTKQGEFVTMTNQNLVKSFEVGNPQLPVLSKLIEVPQGADVKLTILSFDEEIISLNDQGIKNKIIPAQPSLSKSDDPEDVPFYINKEVYETNEFYGAKEIISYENAGQMRATRLGRIEINPFEYNPVTNELKVRNNIKVQVTFENADWTKTNDLKNKYSSLYFDGLTNEYTLNSIQPSKELITSVPVTYVIVAPDSYSATLQDFITWKKLKGFNVIEAYTSETGTTTSSIHDYLQNLYENPEAGVNAPSFVLFVGDVSQIPAYAGTAGSHVSDLYYCEYTGDLIPDVYYGRWSAESTTELEAIINKSMMYEKYEMPDPSYLNEVFLVAGDDESYEDEWGNGQINYGTTYYFNSSNGLYSHTFLQDPPMGNDGVHDSIIADVNSGLAFANYSAHCSEDGWYSPSFSRSDLASLTNAGKYGMWIGNCCLSNKFDASDCFGEIALYSENKGAIGYIGGSNYTYWDEDYWFGVGLTSSIVSNPTYDGSGPGAYDGVFHNLANEVGDISTWFPTQGQVYVAGNLAVESSSSTRKTYYWEIYHLMGDPSIMNYIGIPDPVSVTYDPAVFMIGSTSVDLTTEPYAYIAFTQDGSLIGVAQADASGNASVTFSSSLTASEITVVISSQFHQEYIETFLPIAPEGPYLVINDYVNTTDYGQTTDLDVSLKNVGVDLAQTVLVSATTADVNASLINSTDISYGDIAADEITSPSSGAFSLTVADDLTNGYNVAVDFVIRDVNDSVWTYTKNVTVNAPEISIGDLFITNDNDASGILDPGETGDINFTITNTGDATAVFNAYLSESSDPNNYLTLGSTTVSGISLAPGASQDFVFTGATADINTPLGSTVELQIDVTAGNNEQYTKTDNQDLIIGIIPIYPISDEGTLSVCTGTFYDSGLDVGEYGLNENYTMTFLPGGGADFVVIDFSSFETESGYDKLSIYDGPTTASPLLGVFDGTDSPGLLMGANGLTFNFISDGSVTKSGWEAEVSCYTATEPPECPTNPVPADAATDVYPTTLTWDASIGATSYDVYFGTDSDPYANTPTTVSINQFDVNLDPNTTYYWAVLPTNSIGTATACNAWSFTTGDPVYIMSNTTITTCNGVFYDTGGENEAYQSDENYTMTFLPETAGNMINVEFVSFATEGGYDYLSVYNSNDATNLIGTYDEDDMPPTNITASNSYGALTFVFTSDGSVTRDGWEANITCVPTFDITFSVTDGTSPLEGATVDFAGQTLYTDASGLVTIPCVEDLGVAYTVSMNGYYDATGTVDVDADKTENVVMQIIENLNDLQNEIVISPNPTSGIFKINFSIISANAEVEIFTVDGKKVLSSSITTDKNEFDMSNYESGLYMIKITTKDKVYLQKLVIE